MRISHLTFFAALLCAGAVLAQPSRQEIDELAKWVGLGTVVVIQSSQDS